MERLYLSFNKISGTLPTRIGELTNLREFYAYTNEMTGQIPTELGKLAEIEYLVIGKNDFEGEVTLRLHDCCSFRQYLSHFALKTSFVPTKRHPSYTAQ